MARINYDDQTAAAFRTVREVPREGLESRHHAVRRHLNPAQGMTLVDIGAGTGAFATAFADWFGIQVTAVEPSAAMRAQIPQRPDIRILDGEAEFARGKERLRQAARHTDPPTGPEPRTSWLDLLVLR